MSLIGVSWYSPATTIAPPATYGPARSHESTPPSIASTTRKRPYATTPYPVHASRYPARKTQVGTYAAWPRRARSLVTRANASTIGDTDGSIIAAIIVTQIPRNQPSPPRSVPGPASMPRIRSKTRIQATSVNPSSPAAIPTGLRRSGERSSTVVTSIGNN